MNTARSAPLDGPFFVVGTQSQERVCGRPQLGTGRFLPNRAMRSTVLNRSGAEPAAGPKSTEFRASDSRFQKRLRAGTGHRSRLASPHWCGRFVPSITLARGSGTRRLPTDPSLWLSGQEHELGHTSTRSCCSLNEALETASRPPVALRKRRHSRRTPRSVPDVLAANPPRILTANEFAQSFGFRRNLSCTR